MENKEIKSIIESLLFIAAEPLTTDAFKNILQVDKKETEKVVRELIDEYQLRNSGIFIVEVAGGFQMVTNPSSAPWVASS